jgi:hypothetical protein
VLRVRDAGPAAAIREDGEECGGDGAQAGAVDEFVVPEVVEGRVEQLAGAGEQIEVEECVAQRIGRGEFLRKGAVGVDLVAQGGRAQAVAAVVESFFVALRTRERGDDQEPRGGAVVFGIARNDISVFRVEPEKEIAEESVGCREGGVGKGIDEEAQGDGELGEGDELGDGLCGL